MELTQLKYFQTVSRLEHFTRAAEELHVSQPSLSKSIANLESELGVSLFDRDRRNVHLNGYGQRLLAHVEKIMAEISETTSELSDMRSGDCGDLHIVSSFLFDTPSRIAPFLRQFYFDHPNIHIHVFYQDTPSMIELLRSRKADFAFTSGAFEQPDLDEHCLFTYRLGLLAGRAHPLAGRSTVRLSELSDFDFLANNSSPDLHDTIYDICAKAGFHPRIAFECDNGDLIGEAVARGLGIAFASERRFETNSQTAADRHTWKNDIVFIPVEDDYCRRKTSVAWLKGRYQTTAARMFQTSLLTELKNLHDSE